MVATTMRAACLVGVLVIIACLAETRAYVSFDQVNPDNSTESRRNPSPEDLMKAAAATGKPELIRVPLERRKSRRAIDGSLATINQNDAEKPDRATITEPPVPEDVAPDARQVAKRKHKKLRLSQTQGRKKSMKTKRYIKNADRQQLINGNQNRSLSFGRHRDERYYAQRTAIMDRFRARHREIARKYQQPSSTTTTTTEGPLRYNLAFERLNNARNNNWPRLRTTVQPPNYTPPPLVLASTKPSTMPTWQFLQHRRETVKYHDGDEEDKDDEDDDDTSTSSTPTSTSTTPTSASTTTMAMQPAQPENNNNQTIGDCKSIENLHMVYQHRLVLDIHEGYVSMAEILTPTVEGTCVVCIVADNNAGKFLKDNNSGASILKVRGVLYSQVVISVKFYTDPAKVRLCSNARTVNFEIFTN